MRNRLRSFIALLRGLLRSRRLFGVGFEAEAHLPVLPVLRGQLENTRRQVEEAVVTVCDSFNGIASRARETVGRATAMLGSGGEADNTASMESLIATSRTALGNLLERMERGGELASEAVQRMEDVETAMHRVVKAVTEVNAIAFTNKILALNAKIQAVHVGEAGTAFGVVAEEISNQARRSTQITDEIEDIVRKLRASVEATAGQMRLFASEDRDRMAASRQEVRTTLDALEAAHWDMRASLADTAERSERLADDIARSVMALQFQDRMSQQITHVSEALRSMEQALRRGATRVASGDEQMRLRRAEVAGAMEGGYTMESERAVLSGEAAGTSAAGGGDVELF